MEKIEQFYFSDDEDGGEKLFAKFAAEKHSIFPDDIADSEQDTNKPE